MPVPTTVRVSAPEAPSPGPSAMMRGTFAPQAKASAPTQAPSQAPTPAPSPGGQGVAPSAPRPAGRTATAAPTSPVLAAPQAPLSGNQSLAKTAHAPTPHVVSPDGKITPHNPFEVKKPAEEVKPAAQPSAEAEPEIAFEELDEFGEFKSDAPKVEAPQTEAPAETETPTEPEAPATPEPVTFQPTTPAGRDYSIFDPADVEVLKKLPNAAFDRFKNAFVEKAQLKAKADELSAQLAAQPKEPAFLYEHPDSFMLRPEFTELLQKEDQATALENFYADQLIAAREARPVQIHNAQGQLVEIPNDTGTVDPRVEVYLQRQLNQFASNAQQVKRQLADYQANWRQKVSTVKQQLEHIDKQLFPSWDDNKLTPEEKAIYQQGIELTPEPLRGNHQTRTLARALVAYTKLSTSSQKTINELQARIAELEGAAGKRVPTPRPAAAAKSGEEIIPFTDPED